MNDTPLYFAGTLMAVVALFGLVLASQAADRGFALFGWLLMVFGLAMIIGLIHRGGTTPDRR